MPKDPKGQLRQTTTAKLSRGLLFVFFPNLANTVAEVGKPKPYGSGLEDPPAAGDPEPALAAAAAAATAAAAAAWGLVEADGGVPAGVWRRRCAKTKRAVRKWVRRVE